MVKARSTMSNDVDNAARLEEHARNVMATNRGYQQRSWLVYPWHILTLATIGAGFSVGVLSAFVYPLARISIKFWGG